MTLPTPLRALAAGLLLAAATGCVRRIECTVHQGTTFREAVTPHFRIRSDLPEPELTTAAEELEEYVAALALLHRADLDGAQKLDVIALASQEELREFTEMGGYTLPGTLIVLSTEIPLSERRARATFAGWRVSSVVAHELAHHVHSFVFLRMSRWIAEGLATYEETLELDGTGTTATVGAASTRRVAGVQLHGPLPLKALWAWDGRDDDRLERLYASSWAWMHYLFNERRAELDAFLARLAKAEEPQGAFRAVFGSDDDKLLAGLEKYLEDGTYEMSRYPIPVENLGISIRELTPADVHLARAQLFATAPSKEPLEERTARRDRDIALALTLSEDNPRVALHVATLPEDPGERLRAAEKLVATVPKEPNAWVLLAKELAGHPAHTRRKEALQRAIALEPKHAEALNALAEEMLAQPWEQAGALEFAERAVKAKPWEPRYVTALAAALAVRGRCREAYEAQLRAVDLLHEGAQDNLRELLRRTAEGYRDGRCVEAEP